MPYQKIYNVRHSACCDGDCSCIDGSCTEGTETERGLSAMDVFLMISTLDKNSWIDGIENTKTGKSESQEEIVNLVDMLVKRSKSIIKRGF